MSTAYTKLISSSTTNVLSLGAAKDSLRIPADDVAQDSLITTCLQAAVRFAEQRTERILSESVYQIRIPATQANIVLPYPDFILLTKLEAMTASGARTDLYTNNPASGNLADYITVDDWLNPAEITVLATNIPDTAVYYILTVSFGMGTSVPEDLLNAIKMMINHFFDNPSEVVLGRISTQVPMGADTIFGLHHFKRFG